MLNLKYFRILTYYIFITLKVFTTMFYNNTQTARRRKTAFFFFLQCTFQHHYSSRFSEAGLTYIYVLCILLYVGKIKVLYNKLNTNTIIHRLQANERVMQLTIAISINLNVPFTSTNYIRIQFLLLILTFKALYV